VKDTEVAGKPGDIPMLEAEGTGEMIVGNAQEKIDQFKKVLGQM
jgi:uncharacterized protein YjbJ (UPF0337 family)